MMPSGHKAFLVNNVRELDLLLMHNRTYAAEYVYILIEVLLEEGTNHIWQNRARSLSTEAN